MKIHERTLVSQRVSDWFNPALRNKIVAVDVFDGTYPAMTLSGGTYLDNSVGLIKSGRTNEGASTPDSTALSITGDIDIQVKISLQNWTIGDGNEFVGKWGGAGGKSYGLMQQAGYFVFGYSSDGTNNIYITSADHGITSGAKWVRYTLDANDGSGNSVSKFYLSDNGSTWTQLGTTITTAGTVNIFDSTSVLVLGAGNGLKAGLFPMAGALSRVIIRNGYDGAGSVVFDADFTATSYGSRSFTESSANAAVVTVPRTSNWTGTWSKPAGATMVKVLCVGSGGGGSSGRKDAAGTARAGGGGGSGGGQSICEFEAKELPSTVTVTVGTGGAGAAAQSTNTTNGNTGANGNPTTFGSYCGAGGGIGGVFGGTGDSVGSTGGVGLINGSRGAGRSVTGVISAVLSISFTGGGGGGGGITTGNVALNTGFYSAGGIRSIAPTNYFTSVGGEGSVGNLTGDSSAGGNGTYGCGGGGSGAVVNNVGNSGLGGNGGDGFCVVISYRDCDVQGFTASGTWNKPVGDYSIAKIFVVGGGGGGGSGATGGAGAAWGGGGGAGGGISMIEVPYSSLSNTVTVTVGLGGSGGTGQTSDDTNGNNGNSGGQSSFGTLLVANGGTRGSGGISVGGGGGGGAPGVGASYPGGAGGNGTAVNGSAGLGATSYTAGGGAGAGIANIRLGGAGGVGAAYTSAVTTSSTPALTAGPNGTLVLTGNGFFSATGGGGAGGNGPTANGLVGGNGLRGSGGGGSASAPNTYDSAAGGAGGNGYVCVICV